MSDAMVSEFAIKYYYSLHYIVHCILNIYFKIQFRVTQFKIFNVYSSKR